MEINVFAAFDGNKAEAAVGSDALDEAIIHASSVTHAWRIHQRLFAAKCLGTTDRIARQGK
jgi:hypothetical protein